MIDNRLEPYTDTAKKDPYTGDKRTEHDLRKKRKSKKNQNERTQLRRENRDLSIVQLRNIHVRLTSISSNRHDIEAYMASRLQPTIFAGSFPAKLLLPRKKYCREKTPRNESGIWSPNWSQLKCPIQIHNPVQEPSTCTRVPDII